MKAITRKSILINAWFILLLAESSSGQEKLYPKIGKSVPKFSIEVQKSTIKRVLTDSSLLGQYYILDFWATSCGACVASFPTMDSLQLQFKDNLNIILVGLEEKRRDVRKFYDVYQKRYGLNLNVSFDSLAFNKFVPFGVPHLVWVGRDGIVKAITTSSDVTEENVRSFLSERKFEFVDVSFERRAAALKNEHEETDKETFDGVNETVRGGLTSFVTPWDSERERPSMPAPFLEKIGGRASYKITAAPIDVLYEMAYFGTLNVSEDEPNTYPIPFFSDKVTAYLQQRFSSYPRFSYSIAMPLEIASRQNLMKKMQGDLCAFFETEANIVLKKVQCHELLVIDHEKFNKIKGGRGKPIETWYAEIDKQKFNNVPISKVISLIPTKIIPYKYLHIINQTKYTSNISFELDARIFDLQSIRNGLQMIGLDLVPAHTIMRVLEITEGH